MSVASEVSATPTPSPSPAIRHVAVEAGPDAIFQVLLADGAVIVDGFLTAAQVTALNAELDPANDDADATMSKVYDFYDSNTMTEQLPGSTDGGGIEGFKTGRTKNVTGLAAKSPMFVSDILLHPVFTAMCDRLLAPHCQDYVLNHGHLINVGPGANAQPIHRDEGVFAGVPGLGVGTHLQFAAIIALVDFTVENGATRVTPGSHLWEGTIKDNTGRIPLEEEITQAAMPAGSAVMYLGWTFHGAGQNRTTDQWRRGLHVSYCQGWLRTEENNTLATPLDVARQLPERAQELLGFGVHEGTGMLGLRRPIDQMRDGVI
jgi:hypothetical protein